VEFITFCLLSAVFYLIRLQKKKMTVCGSFIASSLDFSPVKGQNKRTLKQALDELEGPKAIVWDPDLT